MAQEQRVRDRRERFKIRRRCGRQRDREREREREEETDRQIDRQTDKQKQIGIRTGHASVKQTMLRNNTN
jgi:hypothetical protein